MNKLEIKRSFSRAALGYERRSFVQQEVARILVRLLQGSFPQRGFKRALDLGSGDGLLPVYLASSFGIEDLVLTDLSFEMLVQARERLKPVSKTSFLNVDMEFCGQVFKSGAFELVTSNSALHWANDLEATLKGISRVLDKGGVFACTIFTQGTLRELDTVVEEVLDDEIVARGFPTHQEAKGLLVSIFSPKALSVLRFVRCYESSLHLLRALKYSGVSPRRHRANFRPISRSKLRQMDKRFEEIFSGVVVTYEVVCFVGENDRNFTTSQEGL